MYEIIMKFKINLIKSPLKVFIVPLWPIAVSILRFIWRPIGILKFKAAYLRACKGDNVRLNIGCGPNFLDGWLNTDIWPGVPLFLDATKPLPIKNNSVSYIFNEHLLEHLPCDKADKLLHECFRILKPNGILRISTPDIEAYIKAYFLKLDSVHPMLALGREHGCLHFTYPIDILNRVFLENGHKCLYDTETLIHILSLTGFRDIERCSIHQSKHSVLCRIERHSVGTILDEFMLVIEATKPLS